MLIIGAKGFAKEVLEIITQQNCEEKIFFFDDVSKEIAGKLFDKFEIIRTIEDAKNIFIYDNRFTIGVGNPNIRKQLYEKFIQIGGNFTSTISPFANIGHFENVIGNGCNIMTGAIITNSVSIGKGCLINLNCTIGHDCKIGDFVELSPAVNISGNCVIGENCYIGTGAIILPKIHIGKNVTIGAGSLVTKDLPDDVLVYGSPAKVIRKVEPVEKK